MKNIKKLLTLSVMVTAFSASIVHAVSEDEIVVGLADELLQDAEVLADIQAEKAR